MKHNRNSRNSRFLLPNVPNVVKKNETQYEQYIFNHILWEAFHKIYLLMFFDLL